MNLTIVIPFYNGEQTIKRLIDSLPYDLRVIIVDDRSDTPFTRQGWRHPYVEIMRLTRKGYFAGAVNAAIRACKTDVVVLNQDVWFNNFAWLNLLEENAAQYAFIGERITGEHPVFPGGYIHGTFMYMRRDAIDAVGLLNEEEYPLWGNTAEWQWRVLRAGFDALPTTIPGFNHARTPQQRYGSSIAQLLERHPEDRPRLIKTPPLVSVIVPCFNYGRYLSDCINSLIGGPTSLGDMPGQSVQSFEIIMVDDCSTDDSADRIYELMDARKGIFGYSTPHNLGTPGAVNFGIERAHGEYVTFLSADDMREPNGLAALIAACRETPRTFAYDDIRMFGEGERLKRWRQEDFDPLRILHKNHIHAGILYPRKAWEEAGGYPEVMREGREDWAFNIALLNAGWCPVHVRHYNYLYRREQQNRSLTNTSPEHHMRYLTQLQRLFPALYEGEDTMAGCCGGKRNTTQPAIKRVERMAIMPSDAGTTGMVTLEYTGNQQIATWTGEVTHTRYAFGATKRIAYVDRRDAGERPSEYTKGSGFLATRVNGQYVFNVYNNGQSQKTNVVQEPTHAAPTAPTAEKVAENVVTQLTNVEETPTEETPPVSEDAPADDVAPDDAELEKQADETTVDVEIAVEDAAAPVEETPTPEPPNPDDLTVPQITELDLTRAQWERLLVLEEAGRNRVTVIKFIRNLLGE